MRNHRTVSGEGIEFCICMMNNEPKSKHKLRLTLTADNYEN
jgi:hypothetical protein